MQSHCLKHQDRQATARCRACSIPLCDECVQSYEDGGYCSERCHLSFQEGKIRGARLQAQEEAVRRRRQTRLAIKTIIYVVLAFGLFFGWEHLPEGLTGAVEEIWDQIVSKFP
jgi:hypothetical protein